MMQQENLRMQQRYLWDAAEVLVGAAEKIEDDVDKLLDHSQELEDKAIRAYGGSFCTTRNGSKKSYLLGLSQ